MPAKTAEWRMVYDRHVAVERLNGRLKEHRELNAVRVRGRFKARIHAVLSIIVSQAQALATKSRVSVRRIAPNEVSPLSKRIYTTSFGTTCCASMKLYHLTNTDVRC